MPLPPPEGPGAPPVQEPEYGRILFNPGIFAFVASALFLAAPVLTILGNAPAAVVFMGVTIGVLAVAMHLRIICGIPVIETDADGITLRSGVGSSRIFVRWEDANGVVIWHNMTGGERTTMVAISTADDFTYDNYGLFPPVRPYRATPHSKVKPRLRSWSISAGVTSSHRIAKLVNASGKGVPVVEELPQGGLWNHSGPQWGSEGR
ncbi:hypothetical protein [Glycomyces sp. NPDC048151]|uniref:hypothetical protein n=1 Tax=Glycomyces sp. NPDC048151 TaxID=3364002 RepID=UPI00370F87C2